MLRDLLITNKIFTCLQTYNNHHHIHIEFYLNSFNYILPSQLLL